MAGIRLTRRKIADYVARELMLGDPKVAIEQLAAFLIETKRVRELELIVRDIEYSLAAHGETIVDVTSARPLNDSVKQAVSKLVGAMNGASTVHLREHIDPATLGGVRLEYADQRLDATIAHKLGKLRATKV